MMGGGAQPSSYAYDDMKFVWRSLERRHYDARLTMFYKIVNGFVAIPVPPQFECLTTNTRHHPLACIKIDTCSCFLLLLFFFSL